MLTGLWGVCLFRLVCVCVSRGVFVCFVGVSFCLVFCCRSCCWLCVVVVMCGFCVGLWLFGICLLLVGFVDVSVGGVGLLLFFCFVVCVVLFGSLVWLCGFGFLSRCVVVFCVCVVVHPLGF